MSTENTGTPDPMAELQATILSRESKIRELEDIITTGRADNDRLKGRIDEISASHTQLHTEKVELERKYKVLQDRIAAKELAIEEVKGERNTVANILEALHDKLLDKIS